MIKENRWYLIPILLFWIISLTAILLMSKVDLHLILNSYHPKSLNWFFIEYTNVGGWIPFLIGGALLFYRLGSALMVLIPQLLISLPIYVTKQIYDAPRPMTYFHRLNIPLREIAGVDYNCTNSFPSGHTTAAFAMFLSLAFLVKNPFLKFLFFVLAVGVGFSRIYLSQHFASDVLGGSIIGIVFALIYIYFHQRYEKPWMQESLVGLISKKHK